jgi:hypothetical protein
MSKVAFLGFGEVNTPRELIVKKCKKAENALKKEGLDPMKVILNATHTHTSIDYGNPQSKYGSALDVLKKYVPEDFTYTEKVRDDSIIQPLHPVHPEHPIRRVPPRSGA